MILLNSNAYHIYWLGRYLVRIYNLCEHLPFTQTVQVHEFCQAFALPMYDVTSLNRLLIESAEPFSLKTQLYIVNENVQELRGLLSIQSYAEIRDLIKNVGENPIEIRETVKECAKRLSNENSDIYLFFTLGEQVEMLDTRLRFRENISLLVDEMSHTLNRLIDLGWGELQSFWHAFVQQPYSSAFYILLGKLHIMFEARQ